MGRDMCVLSVAQWTASSRQPSVARQYAWAALGNSGEGTTLVVVAEALDSCTLATLKFVYGLSMVIKVI